MHTTGDSHQGAKENIGPKGYEMAGSWRRLHSQDFHNFYSSKNIVRMIKSGRMRWTGHVARMV
jgi:hypothetical protein